MSLEKIVQEAMAGRPLEMKEAFETEIQTRIEAALEAKAEELMAGAEELEEETNLAEATVDHNDHEDAAHAHIEAAIHADDNGYTDIAAQHKKAADHHEKASKAIQRGDHDKAEAHAYHATSAAHNAHSMSKSNKVEDETALNAKNADAHSYAVHKSHYPPSNPHDTKKSSRHGDWRNKAATMRTAFKRKFG